MAWKRFPVWLFAAILTCAVCTTTAGAAVVDKTAPFNGTYFMAYNTSLSGEYSSGVMPKVEWAGEEEPAEDCVMGVDEDENGKIVYRIEPHGLSERLQLPEEGTASAYKSPRRRAAPAQYGDERTFLTAHAITGEVTEQDFVLKYCGEYCNIWLEKENPYGVTDENVTELGAEYDYNIHERMQSAFGPIYDRDGDGKVTFLFYDIQDSYESTGGYVAGFFMPEDLTGKRMNCMDVLHIDTYPSYTLTHRIDGIKKTMVHELQHLIEQSASAMGTGSRLPTWANEGLSMAAEHMFFGPLVKERVDYYNNYVPAGAELTGWNSDVEKSLSYYSMNYLFFQYLRTQTKDMAGGGEELYKYFVSGKHATGNPILDGMRQFYPYISWDDIIRNFYIALTLKEDSGLYGFAGESWAKSIQTKLYTSTASKNLGAGAAIVKTMGTQSYTPSATGIRLRFAAFSPGGTPEVDAPMASTDGGETYKFKNVRLSCCERAATIYYTMDGSEPTPEHGLVYTGRSIPLLSDTTLKAVTYTPEGKKSQVVSYEYTIVKENVELFRRVVSSEEHLAGGKIYDVAPAPEGDGVIVVGYWVPRESPEGEFYDLGSHYSEVYRETYLAKYDWNGNCVWIRSYAFDYSNDMYQLLPVEDGYVLCGECNMVSTFGGNKDDIRHVNDLEGWPLEVEEDQVQDSHVSALIAKVDLQGNLQWATPRILTKEEFTSGYNDTASGYSKTFYSVAAYRPAQGTPGFVAAGVTNYVCPNAGEPHHVLYSGSGKRVLGYVLKVDEQGQVCWEINMKDTPLGHTKFDDVVVLSDDTVVAVGHTSGTKSGALAVAFDGETGEILWQYVYQEEGTEKPGLYLAACPTDDGFIAVGDSYSSASTSPVTRLRADRDGCELMWDISGLRTKFVEAHVTEDGKSVMLLGMGTGAMKVSMKDGMVTWRGSGKPNYARNHMYHDYGGTYLGNDRYVIVGEADWLTNYENRVYDYSHGFISVFLDESTDYYTVSGRVTGEEGAGLFGAMVGGKMTDSQGNYSLRVKEGETVTLTPTLDGHTFTPAFITVGPLSNDSEGNDFTAKEKEYTVSGQVRDVDGNPLPGVAIQNSAGITGLVTDANGAYSFSARPNTTLVLTPVLEGHTFEPAQRTVNALAGDMAGQDFREIPVRYTVSGTVTRDGVGQGGVLVCDGVLTDGDGNYTVTVEKGQDLTLTPSFFRYVFTPADAAFTDISGDMTQNFTMELGSALLVVSPVSKDFGTVYPGYDPVSPQAVRITNAGGAPCAGLTVSVSGSGFDLTGPEATTLNGGESTTFTVAPKGGLGIGVYNGTVTVAGGELSKTVEVTFAVVKAPTPAALELAPGEWDFGTVEEWYEPMDRAVITVRNTGESPCEGLSVRLQEGSDFVASGRLSGALAGGGEETFLLRPRDGLTPGEYEETVTVTNGEVSAQMKVKFTVTRGPAPAKLAFIPAELDFGEVMEGYEPIEETVAKIRNIGGVSCSGLTMKVPEGSAFEVAPYFSRSEVLPSGGYAFFGIKPKDGLTAGGLSWGTYEETLTVENRELSATMKVKFQVAPYREPAQLQADPNPVDFGTVPAGYKVVDPYDPFYEGYNSENVELQRVSVFCVGSGECQEATAVLEDGKYFEIAEQQLEYITSYFYGSLGIKPRDNLPVGVYEDKVIIADKFTCYEIPVRFEVTQLYDGAALGVAPGSYEFAALEEGYGWEKQETAEFRIVNSGDLSLHDLSCRLQNDYGSVFTIYGDVPYELQGGEAAGLSVEYAYGLKEGVYEDTLLLSAYDDYWSVQEVSVPLKLTVKKKARPELKFEPERIDFGPYPVGYGPVEPVSVTVTNIGEVDCSDPQLSYSSGYLEVELMDALDLHVGSSTTFRIRPKTGIEEGERNFWVSFREEFDPDSYEDDFWAELPISLIVTDDPILTAALEVTPASHTFAGTEEGYGAVPSAEFTVKNTGTAACMGLAVSLPENSSFEMVESAPGTLEAGGTATFAVRPRVGLSPGEYEETVTVTAGTLSKTVKLTFTVKKAPAPAALKLEPEELNFGERTEGYASIEKAEVRVTNTGEVSCAGLTISLPENSAFEVTAGFSGTLAGGGEESFLLKPRDGLPQKEYEETVTVANGEISAQVKVKFTVTKTPTPAKLATEPAELDLGSKTEGYDPIEETAVKVKNIGGTSCSGLTVSLPENSGFEIVKSAPDTLEAGGTATFAIRPRTGLSPGTYSEKVTVTAGSLKKEVTVTFEVTKKAIVVEPVAKLEVTPDSHTFAGAEEGYGAVAPAEFTVKNTGTAACTGLTVSLPENSSFEMIKSVPGTLTAGGAETFTLRPRTGLVSGTYTEKITVTAGSLKKEITVTFAVTEKTGEVEPGGEEKPGGGDTPGGEDRPGGGDKPASWPSDSSSSDDGEDPPSAAKKEEKPVSYEERLPYITGFRDGTFRSEESLTRGQCAAILSRLSDDFDPQKAYGSHFPDVAADSWYVNYVGYLTEKNVIRGYPDGTFRPDEPITRAEFVTLLSKGLVLETDAENFYPDCKKHWASGSIAQLTKEGVLNGYPDGRFRPDMPIARSEAVKAVNKAYRRSASDAELEALPNPFSDIEISNWAYYEILEASVKHRIEK